MKIQVQLLNNEATLPIYSTAGAAGCDIFASEDFTIEPTKITASVSQEQTSSLTETLTSTLLPIAQGKLSKRETVENMATLIAESITKTIMNADYSFQLGQKSVATGVAFGIPIGSNVELELRSKSGLAFKKTIHAFNGTADEDYTKELSILMFNLTSEPITFKKGEKVAQGVFKQIIQANFEAVEEFNREVIPNPDRDNNPSVNKTIRTDGFGHTGTTKEGTVKL